MAQGSTEHASVQSAKPMQHAQAVALSKAMDTLLCRISQRVRAEKDYPPHRSH